MGVCVECFGLRLKDMTESEQVDPRMSLQFYEAVGNLCARHAIVHLKDGRTVEGVTKSLSTGTGCYRCELTIVDPSDGSTKAVTIDSSDIISILFDDVSFPETVAASDNCCLATKESSVENKDSKKKESSPSAQQAAAKTDEKNINAEVPDLKKDEDKPDVANQCEEQQVMSELPKCYIPLPPDVCYPLHNFTFMPNTIIFFFFCLCF